MALRATLPSIMPWRRPGQRSVVLLLVVVANLIPPFPGPASAQTSTASATLGRLFIPTSVTGGLCTTHVSPRYPVGDKPQKPATVILRVVIGRAGDVTPMYRISGPGELEPEAMNAARLWKCKPYSRADGPIDILTDISINFTPGQPAGFITHLPH